MDDLLNKYLEELRNASLKKDEPNLIMMFDLNEGDQFKLIDDNSNNIYCLISKTIKLNNDNRSIKCDNYDDLLYLLYCEICFTSINVYFENRYKNNLYMCRKVIKMDYNNTILHYKLMNEIFLQSITNHQQQLIKLKNDLQNISNMKSLINSHSNGIDFYKSYKEQLDFNKDKYHPRSNDELMVINNSVIISEWCEPYHYVAVISAESDLKIGDIVELKFGRGKKVDDRYKGKTLKFVINNFTEYPNKKYILTTISENWTKKDVIIIDDYFRLQNLMEDLWEENQVEFEGWKGKEIKIKKIGSTDKLPIYAYSFDINLFTNVDESKINYYLLYEYRCDFSEICDITDYTILDVTDDCKNINCIKLVTTRDAEIAIAILENKINLLNKKINNMLIQYHDNEKNLLNCNNVNDKFIYHHLFKFK